MKPFWLVMAILGWTLFGTPVLAQDDLVKHPSCTYCGMDRTKYAHSRVLLQYDDGSAFGACSLHCAALDLALNIDKTPQKIRVGDYDTRTLIDAEAAVWTLGGAKPGVMTKRAKWAFGSKEAAQAYVGANGGGVVGFEAAMKAAYEDMYQDTRMIREKRRIMRMQRENSRK